MTPGSRETSSSSLAEPFHAKTNSVRHNPSLSRSPKPMKTRKNAHISPKFQQKNSRPASCKMTQTAKTLMDLYNIGNRNEDEFASLWVCDQKKRHAYEDGLLLTPRDLAAVLNNCHESFPDLKFSYKTIKKVSSNEVTVEGVVCSGTHTGAPFSPLLDSQWNSEAAEATGKYCENDEERIWLKLDENGKIVSCWVISLGDKTGPVGLYEQTK